MPSPANCDSVAKPAPSEPHEVKHFVLRQLLPTGRLSVS